MLRGNSLIFGTRAMRPAGRARRSTELLHETDEVGITNVLLERRVRTRVQHLLTFQPGRRRSRIGQPVTRRPQNSLLKRKDLAAVTGQDIGLPPKGKVEIRKHFAFVSV